MSMPNSIHHLKDILSQHVNQLCQQYAFRKEQKIFAKFDRTLFSQNFENVGFYLQEIENTLTTLNNLDESQIIQCDYLARKLTAQCTALTEALKTKPQRMYRESAVHISPQKPTREKNNIHTLPPAQRLEKYYAALQALNDKIDGFHLLAHDAQSEAQRAIYHEQITLTQQRKQRCLEAIDLLEEYLLYQEGQS
ncbi:primosomal replication protein [Conservatibacter flavescens]|uniref:Primosomal replication protein N n=1 Tax=Conservatibacter flavescens TaxID=28161 RepID=A0A2M8S047_9PAST|nr:primosomal replication protein [Conservatibacter flavescens]PJG84517.1 hypothetical protein CVP05_10880 [Conservatibacter flavescens]